MIVTLAGHVDHGKSALIEALTGVGTDRLAEEQRRGLTIDLGFAYLQTPGRTLGFIDVPGHHRFIHNMVAGVAAHQHALLVVAADDGPMPQSREHLQILSLIGVGHGTVALSKCDRVTPGRIDQARAELAELLSGTFLANAAVFETAAITGLGIEPLRTHLMEAASFESAIDAERPFRLAVDRVFHLKSTGLMATGTVHSGTVTVDQTVYAFPGERPLRVRGLHVQNRPCSRASAGDRAAVNLTGTSAPGLARGAWLTAVPEPGCSSAVVRVRVLDDFPRPLRHWTPVHVYHATRHTTARLALLESSRLHGGEEALAQLELTESLPVKHGDRLVIRDQALDRTVGGGSVVDNRPCRIRRRHPYRLRELEALAGTDPGTALAQMLDLGPVDLQAFQRIWNVTESEFDRIVGGCAATLRREVLVADTRWSQWSRSLLDECEHRHREDGTLQGLQENDFTAPVPTPHRGDLLNALVASGHLLQRAGRYRPARHRVELTPAEAALLERLRPLLDQNQPPSLGDIGKSLRIPLPTLQTAIRALTSKGTVVEVNQRRLYLPEHLETLAGVAEVLSRQGPFTAREYRDAAGIGRNIAIDVLEYFDARGFTRRSGDTRTVVGERSRILPGVG
jgi:selenocysteine-specific elongation factor